MPVPSQSEMYLPALQFANAINKPFRISELTDALIREFSITEIDLLEKAPGGSPRFRKNVEYVNWRLKLAKLTESTSHGYAAITDDGTSVLESDAENIGAVVSQRINDRSVREGNDVDQPPRPGTDRRLHPQLIAEMEMPPEDLINQGYQQLADKLVDELLESVTAVSPTAFEKLTLALLNSMGYGESHHTGRPGDGGIDGIMHVDALGIEKIYVQAKRYAIGTNVREPEIRNFSASLEAQGADKGIFITTSNFNGEAQQAAERISAGAKSIRLVNGNELAKLMIRHGVGVVTEYTYEIKKLDENYFAEEI